MWVRSTTAWIVAGIVATVGWFATWPVSQALAAGPTPSQSRADPAAVERGRVALTLEGFLKPEWSEAVYRNAARLWDQPAPDPDKDPAGYAAAFQHRYGLHPAPYPNDGLPMGLRRGFGPGGVKTGLQIDCMVCHGGSIGGQSYVGLGNTQLDLKALLFELTIADGKRRRSPPSTLNSSRGTNNAGQIAAVLLSLRNPNLSVRSFPLPLAVNLPEMDTPPWWHLKRKRTMYYDGRTDARSVRTNMQFLLGREEPRRASRPSSRLSATSWPISRVWSRPNIRSRSTPPRPRAARSSSRQTCARCHGTYGPDGTLSQQDRPAGRDRHRPGAVLGPLGPAGRPLQQDLARGRASGQHQARRLPGPAARRHLGHRPLLAQRLGSHLARPAPVVDPAPRGSPVPRRPTSRITTRPTSAGSSPRSAPRSWPRPPGGRRFRPSSSSTRPASAWATAATPSAIELSEDRADGLDRVPEDAAEWILIRAALFSGLISSTSGGVVARSRLATSPAWRKARSTLPPRILWTSVSL